jgi:hypothetical protein
MKKIAAITMGTVLGTMTLNARSVELPRPGVFDEVVGMNIHTTNTSMAELKLVEEGGWSFMRADLNWPLVETTKGQYNFGPGGQWPIDVTVQRWHGELGHSIMLILCDVGKNVHGKQWSPEWQDGFVKFAAATAAHYKGKGVIYELLNEPFKDPIEDQYPPSVYVDLARRAAKAIREVDPDAKIVGGVVSPLFAPDYLKAWMKLGLLDIVDALSLHPYPSEQGRPEELVEMYAEVRHWMKEYGGKVIPLMSSECGWYTEPVPNGRPYEVQAQYGVRYHLINLSQGVFGSIQFCFRTYPDPTNPDANWGMMKPHSATANEEPVLADAKPAYFAVQKMAQALKGKHFSHRIDVDFSYDWLLVFEGPDGRQTLAAWTVFDFGRTVKVPGWGTLNLTKMPIYVDQPNAEGR